MKEPVIASPAPIPARPPGMALQTFDRAAPRACLALALLVLCGASLGLCLGFFALPDPLSFLLKNESDARSRLLLSAWLGGGGVFGLLMASAVLLGVRARAVDALCRFADIASPLCLAGLIPVLFFFRAWTQSPLTFLALLALTTLVAEQLLVRSLLAVPEYMRDGLAELHMPKAVWRHAPTAVVVIGALFYASYFYHYTLLNHQRLATGGFDLGINVNWCFNAMHGHPLRSTVLFGTGGGSFLANHAIFAMALWLPLYALHPGAEVLLLYQATMVGMAAIPLYLFASTQLPRWSAAVIAWAYLLYAPLHGPNFYDFHELPVALPWHFLLYWLIATGRLRWAVPVVAIILAHREDMAIGMVILGLFLVLSGARPRFGAWLAVASAVWFVLIKFVIMPANGSWFFATFYKDLIPAGSDGYGAIVQTLVINPSYFVSTLLKEDKLIYFLHLFVPLAFLPARRPLLALLALPGFFITLMTTGYQPTISIAFQYTTHWIPYLMATTVLALKLIGQRSGPIRRQAALGALVLATAAHSTAFGAVFQHESFVGGFAHIQFERTEEDKRNYAELRRLARLIPKDASVAASDNEVPHIAARMDAYTLRDTHGDADYLLIRRGGVVSQTVLKDAFARNDYSLVSSAQNRFFLFKKGGQSRGTQHALAELGIHVKPKAHGH